MSKLDWAKILGDLGNHLVLGGERLDAAIKYASMKNPWFTQENIRHALDAIINQFLDEEKLRLWLAKYECSGPRITRRIGAVLAGNIPMVGAHDIICILAAGHRAVIKLSEKDKVLLPFIFGELKYTAPSLQIPITWVENLAEIDAVVATGSNQSAVYFKKYFSRYPHIIRKNRSAVAILIGKESEDQLIALGNDVFSYFGLGCRNVSKLYVPLDYDFKQLLQAFRLYENKMRHQKYKNNVDFNLATIIINRKPHFGTESAVLIEDDNIASRIGITHYAYYKDLASLSETLSAHNDQIQCIVGNNELPEHDLIPFGSTQKPELNQYADGVDTMEFLLNL
ncbi:MAG: acyl-CoA reductase [Saprospiraceae bacterium]|nr:acyl-CoA reductase [Saprospiraceae bacterium]